MFDYNVNMNLLPMKGHYFLWNAGTAPIISFMSVYAKQLGFSSFIVGIIYTVLPFSGMLAKPTMGAIADRFTCQKIIFLIAQLVAVLAFMSIIFLPTVPITTSSYVSFTCDNFESAFDNCNVKDKCELQRLKDQTFSSDVLCELNCRLVSDHWATICEYWNGVDYCKNHPDNLTFTAHVPMNLTEQVGTCIYFKVKNITFENGETSYPNCPKDHQISTTCNVKCDSPAVNDAVTEVTFNDDHIFYKYQFWALLIVYLIAWIGQAVTVSIGDTICFQLLADAPYKYGFQRMYGALGWGIFSIISGLLVDYFSNNNSVKNYQPTFGIGIGILFTCILVSYKIQYTQEHISTNILRDVCRLLANIRIFVFVLWCICVGVCTALMWNFFFWLLEELAAKQGCDTMNWIKTIEGLAMGIQCLGGELPFFFLSSWILKRIGHVHAMSLVLLAIGIRFLIYSFLTNPWMTLPIELCNGLTFGLFYATMASYASIVAPSGTEATTQGLVGAVFEGIGVSLGSFLGGLFLQQYGGSVTFRIFGISALVASLLHAGVQFIIQRTVKDHTKDAKCASPTIALRTMHADGGDQELKLLTKTS